MTLNPSMHSPISLTGTQPDSTIQLSKCFNYRSVNESGNLVEHTPRFPEKDNLLND
jgi:hypothetical protein